MNDETPRTDAWTANAMAFEKTEKVVPAEKMKELETELRAAQTQIAELRQPHPRKLTCSRCRGPRHLLGCPSCSAECPRCLQQQNEAMRRALEEIIKLRWGYDGDCGAVSIANDALSSPTTESFVRREVLERLLHVISKFTYNRTVGSELEAALTAAKAELSRTEGAKE